MRAGTAAEWAFVIEGRVRTTVIDPHGGAETYETIDLSQWIAGNPADVLATNFSKPESLFAKFPKSAVFIASKDGPAHPEAR
jgi:hypothetical protein